jgi:hypothetical protein
MIQLKLDNGDVFGEIAPYIGHADMQSCNARSLGMSFDHHTYLLSNTDEFSLWEVRS